MAAKQLALALTLCVLFAIVESRRPRPTGRPEGPCAEKYRRCKALIWKAAMAGDCSAFGLAAVCVNKDMEGCGEDQMEARNILKGVSKYVCRCTQMLKECNQGMKTHEHFCQSFEKAAECSADVVDNRNCDKFGPYVKSVLAQYQEIFDKTCKEEKCENLFERFEMLGNCVKKYIANVKDNMCSAQQALIDCAETNFKDCKYLQEKYGGRLTEMKANQTRDCPATRRSFEFLDVSGVESVFGGRSAKRGLDEDSVEKLVRGFQDPGKNMALKRGQEKEGILMELLRLLEKESNRR